MKQRGAYAHGRLPGMAELFNQQINTHELKTHPQHFWAVFKGIKNFEVRIYDRNYKVGDSLLLKEWDPETEEYTGDMIYKHITYILDDPNYCKEGFVILGFRQ